MKLFRVPPAMPAGAYKTYQIRRPVQTHFRPATCAEVQCQAHVNGWKTLVDEATDIGARQAHYIRTQSGRKYTVARIQHGITEFTFEAGQNCFAGHQVPAGRPPIYLVKDGDYRGNPRGTDPRIHTRPEFWVEDFAEHQAGLADEIQKG